MNILVSACLLGINCKYSGGNNLNDKVLKLGERYSLIPVCPEQLGGLPTPRMPSEIKGSNIVNVSGKDVTQNYIRGAKETLKIAKLYDCRYAVLKERSPSCASKEVYDGTFSKKIVSGKGITAALLESAGIEVLNEDNEFL